MTVCTHKIYVWVQLTSLHHLILLSLQDVYDDLIVLNRYYVLETKRSPIETFTDVLHTYSMNRNRAEK